LTDVSPVQDDEDAGYIAKQMDFDLGLGAIEIEDPKDEFELDRPVI